MLLNLGSALSMVVSLQDE